ncbi:MAG TPA: hypothetical protein VNZ53_47345, partial [Steroidobacteraceae bacterium]|nr:hypothetical protein [Steroidobacteraceae bacterium]
GSTPADSPLGVEPRARWRPPIDEIGKQLSPAGQGRRSVVEVSEEPLRPKDGGEFWPDADDDAIEAVAIERRVTKRKGSWWQLPKDLQDEAPV